MLRPLKPFPKKCPRLISKISDNFFPFIFLFKALNIFILSNIIVCLSLIIKLIFFISSPLIYSYFCWFTFSFLNTRKFGWQSLGWWFLFRTLSPAGWRRRPLRGWYLSHANQSKRRYILWREIVLPVRSSANAPLGWEIESSAEISSFCAAFATQWSAQKWEWSDMSTSSKFHHPVILYDLTIAYLKVSDKRKPAQKKIFFCAGCCLLTGSLRFRCRWCQPAAKPHRGSPDLWCGIRWRKLRRGCRRG